MTTGFSAAETHHPSLRRRKWAEKPGSSLAAGGAPGVGISHAVGIPHGVGVVRQSALEKSLSLQAELAQQRPMSMVVPFGGSPLEQGNAIVNQVADTLLQQANDTQARITSCRKRWQLSSTFVQTFLVTFLTF